MTGRRTHDQGAQVEHEARKTGLIQTLQGGGNYLNQCLAIAGLRLRPVDAEDNHDGAMTDGII